MKISKVDHKRTAVVAKSRFTEEKTEGKIFDNVRDPKAYIEHRVYEAKKLYKILKTENLKDERAKELAIWFNAFINSLFSKSFVQNNKSNKEEKSVQFFRELPDVKRKDGSKPAYIEISKKKKMIRELKTDLDQASIHELVSNTLRASFRKTLGETYIPEVVEVLVCAIADGAHYREIVSDLSEEDLRKFVRLLLEDYLRERFVENTARAIHRQSTKVQVDGSGEEARLQLAGAPHPKKKYIWEFVKAYACGKDNEARKEQLRKIKKLIILFYYGNDVYDVIKGEKISLWNLSFLRDIERRSVCGVPKYFSVTCVEKIKEREQKREEKDRKKREREEKRKETGNFSQEVRDFDEEIARLWQEIRDYNEEIAQLLHREIKERWREHFEKKAGDITLREASPLFSECERQDVDALCFWLSYLQREAETTLCGRRELPLHKLENAWLCENAWKNFLAFLASKFVDEGKAVYHFSMPELCEGLNWEESGKPVKIGRLQPEFQDVIISYDYERIKAKESLQRSFINTSSFAAHNFARAACPAGVYETDNNEDVLFFSKEKFKNYGRADAARWILQYFGGASRWSGTALETVSKDREAQIQFLLQIKGAISNIRNASFHYAASEQEVEISEKDKEYSYLVAIYEQEMRHIGVRYREKFYANNVPLFYSGTEINRLMDALYSGEGVSEAQLPSYRNVVGLRADLPEIIGELVGANEAIAAQDGLAKKFHASFDFLLKEIYYRMFTVRDDLLELFKKALEDEKEEREKQKDSSRKARNEHRAIENFSARFDELQNKRTHMAFGEICQQMMTDYNLQNNQKQVRTNKDRRTKEKYEHFPLLLSKILRRAFVAYLKQEETVSFLRKPHFRERLYENLTKEAFCTSWQLKENPAFSQDEEGTEKKYDLWLLSWFITAHFITPKHLNFLKGDIKSYLSYVQNIEERRKGKDHAAITNKKRQRYGDILRTLDLASEYCGLLSGVLSDYYASEDDFARQVAKYVAYSDSENPTGEELRTFCNQEAEGAPQGRIGIFYDGENPIPNRNIVLARLYGTEGVLAECLKENKVTKEDILDFYRLTSEKEACNIVAVLDRGYCETREEQTVLREYQQKKNRIELVDILTYSVILNDLLGQLVSWEYLRERDRLYFQLGIHYIRLYYGEESLVDRRYRELKKRDAKGKEVLLVEDGAILYQLAAIYTYALPVYGLDQNGYAKVEAKAGSMISKGVNTFWKKYCAGDASLYEMGLFLFEDTSEGEAKAIIKFRNYIDHFKYYTK